MKLKLGQQFLLNNAHAKENHLQLVSTITDFMNGQITYNWFHKKDKKIHKYSNKTKEIEIQKLITQKIWIPLRSVENDFNNWLSSESKGSST